jgi:hypothetical protein
MEEASHGRKVELNDLSRQRPMGLPHILFAIEKVFRHGGVALAVVWGKVLISPARDRFSKRVFRLRGVCAEEWVYGRVWLR